MQEAVSHMRQPLSLLDLLKFDTEIFQYFLRC